MIHIYKDQLDEIDIQLITSKFIKVKESRIVSNFENLFAVVHLSLLPNQFLLHITFQHPPKSARKH